MSAVRRTSRPSVVRKRTSAPQGFAPGIMLARIVLLSMLGAAVSAGHATSYVQSSGPSGYGGYGGYGSNGGYGGYGGYGSYGGYGGYPVSGYGSGHGYGSTYVTPHGYGANVHAFGGSSYSQRSGLDHGYGLGYGYGGLGYNSGYGGLSHGYNSGYGLGYAHKPLATSYRDVYQVSKPSYYGGYSGYGSW